MNALTATSNAKRTDMGIHMDNGFLSILQVFDSLFPIGAYTMSNGLETYVQKGIIHDDNSLQRYLDSLLYTLPYSDLGFAAKAAMGEKIQLLDSLCAASKSAYELRQGSNRLCTRFLKNVCVLDKIPDIQEYQTNITEGTYFGCYPVAVGIYIGAVCEEISQGLSAFCYSQLSAAVNHAVKLVPLRQMDGQKVLHAALRRIPDAVQTAMACDITDLGAGGFGFELRSMQHETLYTRIYIS